MGLTVKTTLMTAPVISVPMEEPAWMESTPTTVSALRSGQVKVLLVRVCMCSNLLITYSAFAHFCPLAVLKV